MRILPSQALIALIVAFACTTAPPPPSPPGSVSSFTLSTTFPNGRVDLTIKPAYTLGSTVTVPVFMTATRGSVSGPVGARVVASGVNEGGAPAELLVQSLVLPSQTATPGHAVSTSVSWDGRDAHGALVPPDAYSLLLDFQVDDGGSAQRVTASATLQVNGP